MPTISGCKLTQRGSGRNPCEKTDILSVTEHFCLQDIVNHDNGVLQKCKIIIFNFLSL